MEYDVENSTENWIRKLSSDRRAPGTKQIINSETPYWKT
jgi:hypothetical protein